ncbi:hypothetical protein OfM1_20880 [Lactovum odontotermitis]
MTRSLKPMLSHLVILAADFYLLPLIISSTGAAMFLLLIVMPFICLVSSIVYGFRHSFNIVFVVLSSILFIPSIFIFYNASAWIYVLAYGIITLIGNLTGMTILRLRNAIINQ